MSAEMRQLAAAIIKIQEQLRNSTTTIQLNNSSIEDGVLEIKNSTGDTVMEIGQQWDGSLGATPLTGPEPPTPTTPTTEDTPGGGVVYWDGYFFDAQAMADFARMEVHADPDPMLTGEYAETLRGTIETLRGGEVHLTGLMPGITYYVRLVCRSTSGKRGPASAIASFTPSELEPLGAEAMAAAQAAQVAAVAADQKAVLAQTAADGKSKNWYSTLEPDAESGADGDTWWRYDAAGVIVGVWERKEGAWVARAIGNEAIDAINAGKIATGTLGVGVSINVGDPSGAHLTIDASGPGITVYRPDGDGGLEPSTVLGGEVDQFAINRDGTVLAGISPDGGISGQSLTIASDQVTIDGELLKEKLWEYAWGYQGGFTAPANSIEANPASEVGRNLMNVKWRMVPGRRYEIRFRMDIVTTNMMDSGRIYLGFHYGVDKNPGVTDPRIEDSYVFYPKGASTVQIRPVYGSFLVPYNAGVEQTGAVVANMRNPYWNNASYNTWSGYLLQGSRFSVYDVGPYRPQDTTDSGVMYTTGSGGGSGDTAPPAKQTYVKTYTCTWGKTWTGANPHSAAGQEAWHGNSGWQFRGQLGYQSWASDVSGATITKVEVYLYCRYTYYASGADIGIGVHSNASAPSGYTGASGTITVHFAKPEGKWVTLPSSWYPNFANGTWWGISINPNGVYTPATYAKICGTYEGAGHVASQVRITYTK